MCQFQNALVDYMRRKTQAVGKKFKSRLRFFMVGTCKWNHHEWWVGQGFGKSPSSPKSICGSPLEKVGRGESHYCELSAVPRGLRLGFETMGGGSSLAAAFRHQHINCRSKRRRAHVLKKNQSKSKKNRKNGSGWWQEQQINKKNPENQRKVATANTNTVDIRGTKRSLSENSSRPSGAHGTG